MRPIRQRAVRVSFPAFLICGPTRLDVPAVRTCVYFLQWAAKHFVGVFNAVVDLRGVMIHRRATRFTDHRWFFMAHSEMFSRP